MMLHLRRCDRLRDGDGRRHHLVHECRRSDDRLNSHRWIISVAIPPSMTIARHRWALFNLENYFYRVDRKSVVQFTFHRFLTSPSRSSVQFIFLVFSSASTRFSSPSRRSSVDLQLIFIVFSSSSSGSPADLLRVRLIFQRIFSGSSARVCFPSRRWKTYYLDSVSSDRLVIVIERLTVPGVDRIVELPSPFKGVVRVFGWIRIDVGDGVVSAGLARELVGYISHPVAEVTMRPATMDDLGCISVNLIPFVSIVLCVHDSCVGLFK